MKVTVHPYCVAAIGPRVVAMSKATALISSIEDNRLGDEIYALAAEVFPICRSITGSGVRQTIDVLARHIPIQRHELPAGNPGARLDGAEGMEH